MNLISWGAVGLMAIGLGAQEKAKVEQRRYLVKEVGKCLEGAVIDFAPLKPVTGWQSLKK